MGTLGIIQGLLFHLDFRRNPIYKAEARRGALPFLITHQRGRLLALLSLMVVPIIALSSIIVLATRVDALPIVANLLLSTVWTLPLMLLAGQGIYRERAAQTWPLLLVTPYSNELILLAKAAGGISKVWSATVGLLFIICALGIALLTLLISLAALTGQDTLLRMLLIGFGIAMVIIEHAQEMALSIVGGMSIAVGSRSLGMSVLFSFLMSLLLRLVQMFSLFFLLPRLGAAAFSTFIWVNMLSGSALLLTRETALGLAILVILALVREAAIQLLFRFTLRHIAD